MLICPKCRQELIHYDHHFECKNHHCFDIAKKGYVNLLLGNHKASGDDAKMVKARTEFLQCGYYEPLRLCVFHIVETYHPEVLVDAGCGEGYYTNKLSETVPEIYGFDLSKAAIHQASKASRVHYAVASVFDLPLPNQCADMALSIFAPIKIEEMARIIKDNGYFLKVEPGPRHLLHMKEILYDNVRLNEADALVYEGFELVEEEQLDYEITLNDQDSIQALFQMTPYYWTSSKAASQRLKACSNLTTKIQFHVELYQKKEKSS